MVYFFVGIGGIIGSLLRYFLSNVALNLWGKGFPIGTLLINLTGAFFLGWLTSRFAESKKFPPAIYIGVSTGIIGSYTTFSTFCLEIVRLLEAESYIKGFLYLISSILGGLLLVRLG